MSNMLWLFKAKTIWSHWFKCMFNIIVTDNVFFPQFVCAAERLWRPIKHVIFNLCNGSICERF